MNNSSCLGSPISAHLMKESTRVYRTSNHFPQVATCGLELTSSYFLSKRIFKYTMWIAVFKRPVHIILISNRVPKVMVKEIAAPRLQWSYSVLNVFAKEKMWLKTVKRPTWFKVLLFWHLFTHCHFYTGDPGLEVSTSKLCSRIKVVPHLLSAPFSGRPVPALPLLYW